MHRALRPLIDGCQVLVNFGGSKEDIHGHEVPCEADVGGGGCKGLIFGLFPGNA